MASRSRRGGGGFFGTIVWAILILSLVFAWFKTPVPAGTSAIQYAQAKSKSVEAWVKNFTAEGFSLPDFIKGSDGLPIDIGGTTKPAGGDAPVNKTALGSELNAITVAADATVDYNRDEWKHWSSAGNSCWDTREAVLYSEAKPGTAKLLDKDKKETANKSQACSIVGGEWNDPYTGKTFTEPTKMDVDHMIPLSYAAKHGGQDWDAKKKESYANYQTYAGHLIAVDAGANRSKSDKGPASWKPSNKASYCSYATDWITISKTWGLSTTAADKAALNDMIATC